MEKTKYHVHFTEHKGLFGTNMFLLEPSVRKRRKELCGYYVPTDVLMELMYYGICSTILLLELLAQSYTVTLCEYLQKKRDVILYETLHSRTVCIFF